MNGIQFSLLVLFNLMTYAFTLIVIVTKHDKTMKELQAIRDALDASRRTE